MYRLTLDSTGLLSKNSAWSYRNIIALQKGGTWKDNVNNNRYTWMPGLRYDYKKGHVYLALEFSQQEAPWDFDNVFAHNQPVYGVSYVHPDSKAKRKTLRYTAHWNHQLNNDWKVNWKTNIIKGSRKETQIGLGWIVADNLPLVGYYREENDNFKQLTSQLKLSGFFNWGSTTHNLTLGLGSHYTQQEYNQYRNWDTFVLDIYQPNFNVTLPTRAQLALRHRVGEYVWHDKTAFIQDVIKLNKDWKIRLGTRYTDYKLENNKPNIQASLSKDSLWISSLGVEYQLNTSTTLYSGYSESILPNRGEDKNGNLFDPIKGKQVELGLLLKKSKYQIELAIFNIVQTNLTTRSQSDPLVRVALGEKHLKGLEFSTAYSILPNLKTTLNYNYSNAIINKNNDGLEGNKFPSIPKNSGAITATYQANTTWQYKAGIVYQANRAGDAKNSFTVPSFTRYDVSSKYMMTEKTSINLSIENVLNKPYVTYSTGRDFVRTGNPRTFTLTLSSQF